MAAASMSMKINDTESDRRPLYLFDDENRAKVRRPIGTIDHDGWTYVTYGPLDDWGAHPVQNPNDAWPLLNFTQAASNLPYTDVYGKFVPDYLNLILDLKSRSS